MLRGTCFALAAIACGGGQDNRPDPPSWYAAVDNACLNREREKIKAGAEFQTAPEFRTPANRKVVKVLPNAIAGKRISGRRLISPDAETQMAIRRSGVTKTCPWFKLCLNEQGVPENIEVLRESCFPRYDADILRAMYEWRYSPYTIDGVGVAVCTSITLCYSQGR